MRVDVVASVGPGLGPVRSALGALTAIARRLLEAVASIKVDFARIV